jgi:hypothetical protein
MPGWGPSFLHVSALKWWMPLLLVPLLLLGWAYLPALRPTWRRAYAALVIATVTLFGGLCLARAASNVLAPPDWDVKVFWLSGKVAAEGHDFYSPAAFREVAARAGLHADDPLFEPYVLDVGFLYPAPAMLLIAPFGRLDLRAAVAAWYALQFAALAAALAILWRRWFYARGWLGLGFVTALALMLRGTYTTVAFGQTNFLLLLLLLLFWGVQRRALGGVWLGLGIAVKPLAALLLPYLALRRCWSALGSALGTFVVLCAASVLAFGADPFVSYLAENPVARLPATLYGLEENQSLLAAVVRLTGPDPAHGSPLWHPYHVALLLLVGGVTGFAAWRTGRADRDLGLALFVPAALLVYPQSWEHYTALLLVPIAVLWTRRESLGLSTPLLIAVLSSVYALNRYERGSLAMLGTFLIWSMTAYACVQAARRVGVVSCAGPLDSPRGANVSGLLSEPAPRACVPGAGELDRF